jgi:hypothetical protein
LDDGHRSFVPVFGIENETFAFDQSETFVAFAEADVFDSAEFASEVDGDFAAWVFGEPQVDCTDVSGD